jgi:glycosyltransferase involved in cell wall biosynthesis
MSEVKAMKYLIVSSYPPTHCGIGKYAFQMAWTLTDQGSVVNILSPPEGDGDYTIKLHGGFRSLRIFLYAFFYDRVVIQYHPSFFYSDGLGLDTDLSFMLLFLTLGRRVEVVIHESLNTNRCKRNIFMRLKYLMEKTKWKLCSHIVFHTQKELEDFSAQYFRPAETKYELRPHNLFFHKFRDTDQEQARIDLGLPHDTIIFLCIGFIQPHKGFDLAVKSFGRAKKEDMELYIVGSIRLSLEPYQAYLASLKDIVEKTRNVHLVEKYLTDQEFDTWIEACDVVVVPYHEIWSSGVAARAKLFNKPLIISEAGGLKDQISKEDISFRDENELTVIFEQFSSLIREKRRSR